MVVWVVTSRAVYCIGQWAQAAGWEPTKSENTVSGQGDRKFDLNRDVETIVNVISELLRAFQMNRY